MRRLKKRNTRHFKPLSSLQGIHSSPWPRLELSSSWKKSQAEQKKPILIASGSSCCGWSQAQQCDIVWELWHGVQAGVAGPGPHPAAG